jgi:hypothetical protein
MKKVEFRLSMPNRGSWNGRWSGEGREYLIYKTLSEKTLIRLGIEMSAAGKSWHHCWNDGWTARIRARIMASNERKRKSAGFCGYDWMVENILAYGDTEKPQPEVMA